MFVGLMFVVMAFFLPQGHSAPSGASQRLRVLLAFVWFEIIELGLSCVPVVVCLISLNMITD